ncbi:MAG TPA: methyltransferase domain-containing protein [Candidatus Kapabacteria bacterium]|nr:methyltransferase domain-containing protein [Candidatus Kapabacteria bacterium]
MTYHTGNQLIDPHQLFDKAHLRAGMHVADLGCGRTGHVVFPASVVVGEHGILYAVDILKDALEAVKKRARLENLLNVHTVWADLERVGKTAIPSQSIDVAFLINMLAKVRDRHSVLEETKRLLKEKARCVIVDWMRSDLPFAPREQHLVDFSEIKEWGRSHGFAVQEEFTAGKFHKGIVFFKQA